MSWGPLPLWHCSAQYHFLRQWKFYKLIHLETWDRGGNMPGISPGPGRSLNWSGYPGRSKGEMCMERKYMANLAADKKKRANGSSEVEGISLPCKSPPPGAQYWRPTARLQGAAGAGCAPGHHLVGWRRPRSESGESRCCYRCRRQWLCFSRPPLGLSISIKKEH